MANYLIQLDTDMNGQNAQNMSVQPGDTIYIARVSGGQSGSNHPNPTAVNTKPIKFGTVISTVWQNGTIFINNDFCNTCNINSGQWFYMFSKNRLVNTSGITGYYAETEYRNHSTLPAEIFATAVDYVDSSK